MTNNIANFILYRYHRRRLIYRRLHIGGVQTGGGVQTSGNRLYTYDLKYNVFLLIPCTTLVLLCLSSPFHPLDSRPQQTSSSSALVPRSEPPYSVQSVHTIHFDECGTSTYYSRHSIPRNMSPDLESRCSMTCMGRCTEYPTMARGQ
jgi:hypothetical protein